MKRKIGILLFIITFVGMFIFGAVMTSIAQAAVAFVGLIAIVAWASFIGWLID